MNLKEANEIMGVVNKHLDIVRDKLNEFDKKKLKDRDSRLVSDGLRFSYIELCKLQSEIDRIIT